MQNKSKIQAFWFNTEPIIGYAFWKKEWFKPFLLSEPSEKNKVDESRVPSLSLRQFPLRY